MKVKTTIWDAAEHLKTKHAMADYLACALEDGDPNLIAAALGDIARAQGMTKIARKTGLGRESLYLFCPLFIGFFSNFPQRHQCRHQGSGDRRQGSGVRRQGSGDRRQASGARQQASVSSLPHAETFWSAS